MLTCHEVSAAVTDYLEGALPGSERLLFRLHVALCPDCRRHLGKMRELVLALARLPPGDVPARTLETFRAWRRG